MIQGERSLAFSVSSKQPQVLLDYSGACLSGTPQCNSLWVSHFHEAAFAAFSQPLSLY